MIRWRMGKEHPLKDGGKFFPLAEHDGVVFGRRQLPGENGWHPHSYPKDTADVLDIPIPNTVWYMNIGIDPASGKYLILTNPTIDKARHLRDKRHYDLPADRIPVGGYLYHKEVIISAVGEVQDPSTWNAAVNGVINLLRVNNDLSEERQELIESLLREIQ